MKQITNYITEKFKINSKTISDQNNPLFDLLDTLLDEKTKTKIVFTTSTVKKIYHVSTTSISYNERNDYVKLESLFTEEHNKGYGTKFMKDLCEWCDINNKKLCLTPTNDYGSNLARLKKFYKRFGFTENKGQHTDFTTKETMIRIPNNK